MYGVFRGIKTLDDAPHPPSICAHQNSIKNNSSVGILPALAWCLIAYKSEFEALNIHNQGKLQACHMKKCCSLPLQERPTLTHRDVAGGTKNGRDRSRNRFGFSGVEDSLK